MTAATTSKTALGANSNVSSGIDLISSADWITLAAFFDFAIDQSPGTEAAMRSRLAMDAKDAFPSEFAETVALYATLQGLGHEFENTIVTEVLACADDIVHYQTTADTVYSRLAELIDKFDFDTGGGSNATLDQLDETQAKLDALVNLWKAGAVSGRSETIKVRFSSALEMLIKEAETRAQRAEDLQAAIRGDKGLESRIKACKAGFLDKATQFKAKYGTESAAIDTLRTKLASYQEELDGLRKKERDEVIVLSTSPAYLAIPAFGPFILAGVDIGVGVDLAHVRASIDSKVKEFDRVEAEIALDVRFMAYYDCGTTMVTTIADRIDAIVPKLEQLGLGWRSIAADIGGIVKSLKDTGRDQLKSEDYYDFVTTLKAAQKTWASLAQKADHFRSVARPIAASSADDLVKKAA